MILRKPYGFLIKHFKLIHLIITIILGYLVTYSNKLFKFLKLCIDNTGYRYEAMEYINYSIYIWILIAIGLFLILYLLLKYKDKPRRIYIFTILWYLILGIYMYILLGYISNLPDTVIEAKVIRNYKDITLITLIIQYLIIIIMFIRALGFNIKKFNFEKDMQELNLSNEDSEEVELNIDLDTTDIIRNLRKKREFGYYFQEYKIIILGILAIVLVCILWNFSSFFKEIFIVYKEGKTIGNINFVTVKDSYYNMGDDDYIVVKFDISKNGKKEQLNIDNMVLLVGKEKYYPNKNICNKFNKIGNCYKKQYITNNNKTYIITYKVDSINSKKTYLLYNEGYENSYKIKLDLENYE